MLLRQAMELAQGRTVGEICQWPRRIRASFLRWRAEYAA